MKTVLFDMDGTLTEARSRIDISMIFKLAELSKIAKIGIVTGSDMKYIKEQCGPLWDTMSGLDVTNVFLMPCNGTKMYEYTGSRYEKTYEADGIIDIYKSENILKNTLLGDKVFPYIVTDLYSNIDTLDQLKYVNMIMRKLN